MIDEQCIGCSAVGMELNWNELSLKFNPGVLRAANQIHVLMEWVKGYWST